MWIRKHYLKQLVATFRLFRLNKKKMPIIVASVAAIGLIGAYSGYRVKVQNNAKKELEALLAKEAELQASKLREAEALAKLDESNQNETQQTEQYPNPAPAPASQKPKYSTSSDPRSTAYSDTPPPDNPASFEIKITSNNQLSPGTLLYNNSTKGLKGYYGGDLVCPSTVTLKRDVQYSNVSFTPVQGTCSTPDGTATNPPTEPWNDFSSIISMHDITPSSKAANYQFYFSRYNDLTTGTYVVHVYADRDDASINSWSYHKFINVVVE